MYMHLTTTQIHLPHYPTPACAHVQAYLQRGYLGATMIVLFMLICTSGAGAFAAAFRRSGAKTQVPSICRHRTG